MLFLEEPANQGYPGLVNPHKIDLKMTDS